MPRFKYFDEVGNLITERRETLDESNIERFIAKHGEEKAAIYLEALYDVCMDMRQVRDVGHFSDRKLRRAFHAYHDSSKTFLLRDAIRPLVESVVDIDSLSSPTNHV
jgi:hypothetical protein